MPASHSEDFLITYEYDGLERDINVFSSDGVAKTKAFTNMGQISLERQYDTYSSGPEGTTDPDQTRTLQTRYDGWEHPVQIANPAICQQLAEIEADSSLTPEQKQVKNYPSHRH